MKLAFSLLGLFIYADFATAESADFDAIKMEISSQIHQSLSKEYGNNLKGLDVSFRFPRYSSALVCRPDTLNSQRSNFLGATYWKVDCSAGERSHTLKVRAITSATLSLPVPERFIPKGEEIHRQDWVQKDFELKRASSMILVPDECYLPRRGLIAGKIVKSSNVRLCFDMAKGESVNIISGRSGVSVEVVGELIKGGRFGKRVDVRNVNSGVVLTGVLEKGGIVRL